MSNPEGFDHFSKTSLKDQAKMHILRRIQNGEFRPGTKIPTQRAWAKILGVSNKTAETALKELEFEKVLFRRVGKGTVVMNPRRDISGPVRSDAIAVFVPNITNPVFSLFCNVAEAELFKQGKTMMLGRADVFRKDEQKYIQMLIAQKVGGVIIFGGLPSLERVLTVRRIPFVKVNSTDVANKGSIIYDLKKAGYRVANYLYALGHRQIVCAGCFPVSEASPLDSRFQAVLDYFRGKRVSSDEITVIPQEGKVVDDYEKNGVRLTEKILALKRRPTAVVFYNDARAFGALKAFATQGISVPRDISVVSFDNVSFCDFSDPPLTSVDFEFDRGAREAVRMLVDNGRARCVELTPKLVIRKSAGRPAR